MGNKDAGNLGMQESVSPAQNEMYADFIVKYMGDFQEDLGDVPGFSFQKINGIYGVVYAPLTEIGTLNINTYSYSFIPNVIRIWILEALVLPELPGFRNIPTFS